ncbi:MAG: carbohydrate ABC transporter permease [Lachnospiraceae bacterium]|nr:carbohydrate ABC transporter permease [Lachnospiraceae bacterium]
MLSFSKNKGLKIAVWVFVAVFLIITIFPFFWIVITSFKPEAEILSSYSYQIIANSPTFENFRIVVQEKGIMRAVKNSFVMSGITTLYVIVVASMSAYIISRFKFKGKTALMTFILGVSMFPQMTMIGPLFNMFYKLNMLNSYWVSLAYSTITLPLAVWILVAHFNQVPLELEDAAKVDGCTSMGILWKVVFPLAAPGIFTAAIMTFISAWNEYLLSCTMNVNESMQTVPVRLSYMQDQFTIYWGQVCAASVIVIIPTLIIVLLCQKQIVSGIADGAVKG